jgi:hypothetical protein
VSIVTRPVSVLEKGTSFSRFVQALGWSKLSGEKPTEIAERWRDSPQVKQIFAGRLLHGFEKAEVGAGGLLADWGPQLQRQGVTAEVLELECTSSAYGGLGTALPQSAVLDQCPSPNRRGYCRRQSR